MVGQLWTGIAGLSSQQKALDNESHNIANVNTIGYKASRVSFADQMYQDAIGKGTKLLNAEKIFTQGNLKATGIEYDMALKGDGFFSVTNPNSSGSKEEYYTRAGNFRMGQSGTLQTSNGFDVQGWPLSPIDTLNDVISTDHNTFKFTDDYEKILGTRIIRHETFVETITAKATDYKETAKSDPKHIFLGAGGKTSSTKIQDVEIAMQDYQYWLDKYKQNPNEQSSLSSNQISHVNFASGNDSLLSNESSQIYIYINGDKITQSYVPTSASNELMKKLYASDPTLGDPSGSLTIAQKGIYDKLASRIETYKALTDKISNIPGLVAYTVKESVDDDALSTIENFELSTDPVEILKGIIEIKSLIPGKEVKITEAADISNNNTVTGSIQNTSPNVIGSGLAALESSRDALAMIVNGSQQDIFTKADLMKTNSPAFSYSINIYDKNLKQNIPVPNNGGTPLLATPLTIVATDADGNFSIDEFVNQFNTQGSISTPPLTDYVEALNLNGNLVIRTLEHNFDVEFTNDLQQLPCVDIDINEMVDNATYSLDLKVNGIPTPISVSLPTINAPALDTNPTDNTDGSINYIDIDDMESLVGYPNSFYQDIYAEIEAEVANINAANPDAMLALTPLNEDSFTIYTTNKEADFENTTTSIVDNIINPVTPLAPITTANYNYEKDQLVFTDTTYGAGEVYSVTIMGQTFTVDDSDLIANDPTLNPGDPIAGNVIASIMASKISADPTIGGLVQVDTPPTTIGDPSLGGVLLTNGLDTLVPYTSDPEGRFMVTIPANITDLTLYLNEMTMDDTFQIFTKSGKHIAGTPSTDASWTGGNTPANIIANNPSYFDVGAIYVDELAAPSVANTYYGPYNSVTGSANDNPGVVQATVNYIDKNGNPATKDIYDNEEMVVIPNTGAEELVIFINGQGSYNVSAEWSGNPSASTDTNPLTISQIGLLDPLNPSGMNISGLSANITNTDISSFEDKSEYTYLWDFPLEDDYGSATIDDDDFSSSIISLTINGQTFEVQTDDTPDLSEIQAALQAEIDKVPSIANAYSVQLEYDYTDPLNPKLTGNLLLENTSGDTVGAHDPANPPTLTIRSMTDPNDQYITMQSEVFDLTKVNKNVEYSNRKGAGAEFLEIKIKVDQQASRDSIQLRLDNLNVTDSPFGEFEVDATGLITMKQDGVNFAIGQVSIAMFNNQRGLEAIGNNFYSKTNKSGQPIYNLNNEKSAKTIGKTLELSTSDLSESLVNLMVFQRAFETNSKSIMTADTILNTLIQIKK